MIVDTGTDLRIAHDGDTDRCVFVTFDGRYVSGDQALAVLSIHPKKEEWGKVVVIVVTSSLVEESVKSAEGAVEYIAVSSLIVARIMTVHGGVFGGEENGA